MAGGLARHGAGLPQTTRSDPSSTSRPPAKGLPIALWVAQVLLALMFGSAGLLKSTAPIEQVIEKLVWPGALPVARVRFIGVCELSASVGLICRRSCASSPS